MGFFLENGLLFMSMSRRDAENRLDRIEFVVLFRYI